MTSWWPTKTLPLSADEESGCSESTVKVGPSSIPTFPKTSELPEDNGGRSRWVSEGPSQVVPVVSISSGPSLSPFLLAYSVDGGESTDLSMEAAHNKPC